MRVLYIGHNRENSGWSRASIDLTLALNNIGVDVVSRSIKINNARPELPQKLLELENKSLDGVTHCIQHVLPHYLHYNSKVKCISYFVMESSSCKYSNWPLHLNQMDEIWVPNWAMTDSLKRSSIQVPTRVVPHAVDLNRFNNTKRVNLDNNFKFYSIVDLNKRKNIIALLRAFHTEFHYNEPVSLVLKIRKGQFDELNKMCQMTKEGLKLYRDLSSYKNEIVIEDNLSDEDIIGLHNSCQCYVCTSYNEAWCQPLIDAMGVGNLVISNNIDGPKEFIEHEVNGYLVPNQKTPCFNTNDTFRDIYTGKEYWYDISIPDLMSTMRKAFNYKGNMGEKAKEKVQEYSYQTVGNLMKESLCLL